MKQQLRSALVAAQWQRDTALILPLFWRRSTVSPVFFGRYPRSSLHSFSPSPLVPVPNKQTRFCGRKAKCTRLTLTETIRTIRDGEPRTSTSNFTQLLSSDSFTLVQCSFTSTKTIRTIRDGEPRAASSTFTQLLSSAAIDRTWPLFLRVSHCGENLTYTNNAKRWARLLAAENR